MGKKKKKKKNRTWEPDRTRSWDGTTPSCKQKRKQENEMQRFDLPEEGMFLVTKTSGWPHEEAPCDGAFQAEIQLLTWCGGQYTNSEKWTKNWFVRVPNILELVKEVKHPCIVDLTDGMWPSIEIYDDYRE